MTRNIGTDANIDQVRLKQETAHPSAPASGYELIYVISGSPHGGLFLQNSAGEKIGPFITGSPANASTGALIFLGSRTASNSLMLLFDNLISATYDKYVLEIVDFVAQTNNVDLLIQYSSNNGSSYATGSDYYNGIYQVANGGSAGGGGGNPTTAFQIALGISNTSSRPFHATIHMQSFPSTALSKAIYGNVFYTNQSNVVMGMAQGLLLIPGTAYNSFRLMFSGGNIVSGVARLYGVANS